MKEEIKMVRRLTVLATGLLLAAASSTMAADGGRVILTSSNALANELLVFSTSGVLVQSVPTQGQGGAGGNAGGIATSGDRVAVVNFGSQNVSLFSRTDRGFELRQTVAVASQPVSVAFGHDHLYVLGTTTLESHGLVPGGVREAADGLVALLVADGSAAQVGVAGDELIVSEKGGTVERIRLRDGAVSGTPQGVQLPPGSNDTPFGLVTRGSTAYVTVAASDAVAVVKNGVVTSFATTGVPGGAGQHSPCWIAVVGPFLFTTNSPSHSVSRLVAGGRNVVLDSPVAAQTNGAPIDIAADRDLVALIESDGGGLAHVTQFHLDADGTLTRTSTTAIASAANGIAIVSGK
ncbi:MAG TPA: hypothetical protein VF147_12515 [Vicinamibacterales bacterium]